MDKNIESGGYTSDADMQRDTFLVKNLHKSLPRPIVLIVVSVVLVVGAVGAILVSRRTTQTGDKPKTVNETATIKGAIPTPTGKISDVLPWAFADTKLATEPPLPTAKELDQIYQNLRSSVSSRNFDQAKSLISKERTWHIENPKRFVGGLSAGGDYFEAVGESGEKNFIHSPYAVLFNAPPQAKLIPLDVRRKEFSSRPDILLVNPQKGTSEKVSTTIWRYAVELKYSIDPSYKDQGTGGITFVYDDEKWVFQGQDWILKYQENAEEKGDKVAASVRIQKVEIAENGACSPGSVKIKAGEAVRWNPITGMIYTIVPSGDHWDSGYLYKDVYTKQFTRAGSYVYIVQQPPRDPNEFSTCTITVQ